MGQEQNQELISFNCPSCQKLLKVRQNLVGRTVKCPACMNVIQIPDSESMPTQPIPMMEHPPEPKPAPRSTAPISRLAPASKPAIKPVTGSKLASGRLRPGVKQLSPEEQAAKKKKTMMMLGGAIAGVIIIVLIAVFMSAQSARKQKELEENKRIAKVKQEQEEKEAREQKAQSVIKDVVKFEESVGVDYGSLLKKIREKKSDVKGTPFEKELAAKEDEVKQKVDVLRVVRETTRDFESNPKDFDRIIKQYDKLREDAQVIKNTDALVNEIEKLKVEVVKAQKKEVENVLASLESNVGGLMDKNQFKEALFECNKTFKDWPDAKSDIEKIVVKINQAQAEYQKKRYDWQVLYDGSATTGWDSVGCNLFIETDGLVIENKSSGLGFAAAGQADWQNYTVELNFKMVQGAVTIAVRFKAGEPSMAIPVARKFGSSWEKVTVTVKDNEMIFKQGDGEVKKVPVPDGTSAQGKVGFILKPNDKIIIKDIKAKLIE
ncbi:MAG: hypothetical protein WC980_07015 [Candidatus Brocadiia bacterium]